MAITLCTVTGNVQNLLGSNVQACNLKVTVPAPFFHPALAGTWISGELASTSTDASGNFSVIVVETATPGQKVTFTFDYYDGVANRRRAAYSVVVPNQGSALLSDLVSAAALPNPTVTFPAQNVTVNPAVAGLSSIDAYDAFAELAAGKASSTLASAHIYVGNASNVATDTAVTGDIGITNAGVTAIQAGVIVNSQVNSSAAIAYSKLSLTSSIVNADISSSAAIARSKVAAGTASHVLVNDGSGNLSSEATLAKSRGGTGQDNSSLTFPASGTVQATTPNAHGVLLSGSGATATVLAPDASTAKALISGGASADPAWGVVAVAGGGTGIASGTSGGILGFTGTTTVASSALLAANQVMIGGGAGVTPSTLAAGSQYQVLTMGASNPGYGQVNLAQSAAVTGVLPNANTTATNANTASTIVARDGSGNFTAGTVTAALTGTASGNTTYTANNHGVVLSSSTNAMTVIAPDSSATKVLKSGGASEDPSWLSYSSAGAASNLVFADANANHQANNVIENYRTVATGGTTTTLTVADAYQQYFTGSTTQTVVLPDATTLVLGHQFFIRNASSGVVTVQKNGGTSVQAMAADSFMTVTVTNIGTAAGSWSVAYAVNNAGGGTVTSVAATVPTFLSVSGSPVTTSGTLAITLSGTALPIANGGTSGTTKAGAFDALQPMTTGGDLIYGGASGTGTRLANGSAGQILTSAGGTSAPTWSDFTVYSYSGYHTTAASWSRTNASMNTFTATGTPALTSRLSNNLTVSTAASSAPGISFTAPFTGTIFISAVLKGACDTQNAYGNWRLEDVNGDVIIADGQLRNQGTNTAWSTIALQGTYNITNATAYTFRILGSASAGTVSIVNGDNNQSTIEWTVYRIR